MNKLKQINNMKVSNLKVTTGLFILFIILLSCNKEDKTFTIINNAELKLEYSKGLRGQNISLFLVGINGENFTEEATFYINDSEIESAIFSSQNTGVYEVFAEYNLAGTITQTPPQNIEVFTPKRKIFIDMTMDRLHSQSPKVNTFLDKAKNYSDNILNVCWVTSKINIDDNDPLSTIEGAYMSNNLDGPIFPNAYINREDYFSINTIEDLVINADGFDSAYTLGITSSLLNQSLNIKIDVVSEEDMFENKLAVYLIEDNVIGPQRNSFNNNEESEWFDRGDPILDFEYSNLFRESITSFLGDYMEFTPALNPYTKEFIVDISNEYNIENLKVLAYITNGEDFIPINSQIANINTKVAFE